MLEVRAIGKDIVVEERRHLEVIRFEAILIDVGRTEMQYLEDAPAYSRSVS